MIKWIAAADPIISLLTFFLCCSTFAIQGGAVMALDATCQIRMNSELKAQVEELYRNLGTSFAEAVRIFAQQSLREGGLPFRPALKTWDELTEAEIDEKLS